MCRIIEVNSNKAARLHSDFAHLMDMAGYCCLPFPARNQVARAVNPGRLLF